MIFKTLFMQQFWIHIGIVLTEKFYLQSFQLTSLSKILNILYELHFLQRKAYIYKTICCLEITISLLIKKMHTSNCIFNAYLKNIFLVRALYALDFKCLEYIPNKYVLILSVVINVSVMHSICCKKQGQNSWFQYTSFNLIQVTILVSLKIIFLFFKWLKNISLLHSIHSEKYE